MAVQVSEARDRASEEAYFADKAADPYLAAQDKYRDDPGYGWVTFAGVLLLIIGALSLILGFAALGNSHFSPPILATSWAASTIGAGWG